MPVRVSALALVAVVALLAPGFSPGAEVGPKRVADLTAIPELPKILGARVVLGTKFGTAVRVSYCYSSMPSDPSSRPGRLHLTVDNLKDDLPPLSIGWAVTTRCNAVVHPVGGIQQPYVLRYTTESADGRARSRQGLLRLQALPELARRPELPTRFAARVVSTTEYPRAIRISYCFRAWPRDLSRRPSTLWVTIVNAKTDLREAGGLGKTRGGPHRVTSRCGVVTHPATGIEPPYRIFYSVVSVNGTRTKRAQIVTS